MVQASLSAGWEVCMLPPAWRQAPAATNLQAALVGLKVPFTLLPTALSSISCTRKPGSRVQQD